MTKFIIILTTLFANAVADEKSEFPDLAEDEPKEERWPSSIVPTKQQLEKFGEPILSEPAQKLSMGVRFIWVPTFDSPISIRASKQNDKMTLSVVQMSGKGGYDWGSITKTTINIDDKQWAKLVELCAVDGARKPSQKLPKDFRENFVEAMSGLDGSKWFLEVNDAKGYTVEGIPNPIIEDCSIGQDPEREEQSGFQAISGRLLLPF